MDFHSPEKKFPLMGLAVENNAFFLCERSHLIWLTRPRISSTRMSAMKNVLGRWPVKVTRQPPNVYARLVRAVRLESSSAVALDRGYPEQLSREKRNH